MLLVFATCLWFVVKAHLSYPECQTARQITFLPYRNETVKMCIFLVRQFLLNQPAFTTRESSSTVSAVNLITWFAVKSH